MGGLEILLLLIGAVVGASLMFWWQEDRIKQLKNEHRRALRKVIETTERQNIASRVPNTAERITSSPIEDKGLSPTIMQAATAAAIVAPIVPPEPLISALRSPGTPSDSGIDEPVVEPTIDEQIISELTIDQEIANELIIDESIIETTIDEEIANELIIDEPIIETTIDEEITNELIIDEPIIETTIDEEITNETIIDEPIIETTIEPLIEPAASTPTEPGNMPEILTAQAKVTEPPVPMPTQTEAEPPLVTQIFDEPPLKPSQLAAYSQQQPIAIPNQTFRRPLKDQIVAWGQIASPSYIPQLLQYVNHHSPNVREDVAKALGQIAASHNMHNYESQVITVLEQFSRDRHLEVRYQAIVALGHIKSGRVIPALTSALRDPSSKLVKAASSALARLKYYALPTKPQPIKPLKRVIYSKPIRWL
jgi:HEAT repeats/HEAT repeat